MPCVSFENVCRSYSADKAIRAVVCYGGARKGAPLSKQRLSQWVVEVIALAYKKSLQPVPGTMTCHSTRAVSSSWVAFRGV